MQWVEERCTALIQNMYSTYSQMPRYTEASLEVCFVSAFATALRHYSTAYVFMPQVSSYVWRLSFFNPDFIPTLTSLVFAVKVPQHPLPPRHNTATAGESTVVYEAPRKTLSTGSKRSYQDMDNVSTSSPFSTPLLAKASEHAGVYPILLSMLQFAVKESILQLSQQW